MLQIHKQAGYHLPIHPRFYCTPLVDAAGRRTGPTARVPHPPEYMRDTRALDELDGSTTLPSSEPKLNVLTAPVCHTLVKSTCVGVLTENVSDAVNSDRQCDV